MLLDLIGHNDHRRITAETFDQSQPVFKVRILLAFTGIEDQEVQTALSHEKLVRRVHDLLSAKVPDIEPHLIVTNFHLPRRNRDAISLLLSRIKRVTHESLNER